MNYVKFLLGGKYAHFRLPFANNAPMTFTILPKSALVGLLGAVVGIEREIMKPLYKEFCKYIKYSVAVKSPIRKVNHTFTLHSFHPSALNRAKANEKAVSVAQRDKKDNINFRAVIAPSPSSLEYLEDVSYEVLVSIADAAPDDLKAYFDVFTDRLRKNESVFDITLGARNCPADIEYVEDGELKESWGSYSTQGFVTNLLTIPDNVLVENLPTRMIEDRLHDMKSNIRVFFFPNESLSSEGLSYVDASSNKWNLI